MSLIGSIVSFQHNGTEIGTGIVVDKIMMKSYNKADNNIVDGYMIMLSNGDVKSVNHWQIKSIVKWSNKIEDILEKSSDNTERRFDRDVLENKIDNTLENFPTRAEDDLPF